MRFVAVCALFVLCILCDLKQSNGARILVVFPIPSYSHQVPFHPLWIELHKRGHELVIIACNTVPNMNSTKFRQIKIETTYTKDKQISFMQRRLNKLSWVSLLENEFEQLSLMFLRDTFTNPEVMELYAADSNEKFDVVMVEMLHTFSVFAYAHRFNAPIIGLSSLTLPTYESYALGGLVMPSHESTWEMEANVGANLSFWQRLKNFWTLWHMIYVTHRKIIPNHQKLAEMYFGEQLPPILDLMKNTSLVFVNENPVMTYARPNLANIVRFHSIHVSGNRTRLPPDLQAFVDSATNGFIYFCLGTNVLFSDLPDSIQEILYDVFAKLPYKIVLKANKEPLWKLDNVFVSTWFNQQSILAHPNIKLYMFQGGLQSTQEAIRYTVPLLGFPVLSDQEFQLRILKFHGVAERLYIETLTRDELEFTINKIINNEEYKQNMIELRKLVNDTPYNLIENLVWWTEYVIRNKGAPHLRSNLVWEPWYRYYDMDIVAFLAVATFIFVLILLKISPKVFTCVYRKYLNAPINLKIKIS